MCVFNRQVLIRFYLCYPTIFGVNIYLKISPNILPHILLFYLSLNPVPYIGVVSLVCLRITMTAVDALLGKPKGCLNISHITQGWDKRCATDAFLNENGVDTGGHPINWTVNRVIWHNGESHLNKISCS